MLFNSYAFICVFWPLAMLGFFSLARVSYAYAAAWLAVASLGFYAYWNPTYVALLCASIAGNYLFGRWIAHANAEGRQADKKRALTIAICANLALLAYYKYANFFLTTVNELAGTGWSAGEIMLPLGISFFTFTQIAYLVDTYQGKVTESNVVHYLLFVTYFPHLIAGPVLHHKQMMPQFKLDSIYRIDSKNLRIGLAFFSVGLAKKVLLADGFAGYATPIFDAAGNGVEVSLLTAWIGLMAYTLQLYFDFSGYSDMAIGISKTFGIDLPFNFNSPYKARNIVEFWRRWHMTLSQFLRDYLYIPLGGNRKGPVHRYVNLLITMLLGGLWHGANWTFVIWGGLHGVYLVINNLWIRFFGAHDPARGSFVRTAGATLLTFLAVCVGWVFFRAESVGAAMSMFRGLLGFNGISLPRSMQSLQGLLDSLHVRVEFSGIAPGIAIPESPVLLVTMFALGFTIIWGLPNSQQWILRPEQPGEQRAERVTRSFGTAILCGVLFGLSFLSLSRLTEFLYFQF